MARSSPWPRPRLHGDAAGVGDAPPGILGFAQPQSGKRHAFLRPPGNARAENRPRGAGMSAPSGHPVEGSMPHPTARSGLNLLLLFSEKWELFRCGSPTFAWCGMRLEAPRLEAAWTKVLLPSPPGSSTGLCNSQGVRACMSQGNCHSAPEKRGKGARLSAVRN